MSGKTVGKGELIEAIAKKTGSSKREATDHLTALLDLITTTVSRGNKVTITGFGSFSARKRAARVGHNPATGEPVKIKANTVAAFKPGSQLKAAVGRK